MSKLLSSLDYWGKSGEGQEYHPLIYHQLDVAACGIQLIRSCSTLRTILVEMSGLDDQQFEHWLGFFLAIHDLGKFSSAFQQLRADLTPRRKREYFYTIRHDTLGHLLWKKQFAFDDELLSHLMAWPDDSDDPVELLDAWIQCVTGHHGQPPDLDSAPVSDHFSKEDIGAAREWIETAAKLFLPTPRVPGLLSLEALESRMGTFSWYLAGLCTLADWLGSNRDHFPYCLEGLEPGQYLENHAIPNAQQAIVNSGLLPASTAPFSGTTSLFDFIQEPTPLQSACLELPIANGPQLHILEDVTGAGKTEAAFILLARIMASGQAQGAYIALPTMATANAMYGRTANVYRRLYEGRGSLPSLVLAHGARKLDQSFIDSLIHPEHLRAEGEYSPDEFDAEARCNSWLADNNKKALLAHMGVGTIDQALLAVLQSRHQSMRLIGLVGKVLIVDEVHASDAYMHTLLCQLISMHARAGGSAILLSATLPGQMRDDLIQAFSGDLSDQVTQPEDMDYPLLTSVQPNLVPSYQPVATRESVRRSLQIRMFNDEAQTANWIIQKANQGCCVAWVRNTVGDAIDAWRSLSAVLGQEKVILFHARFAMGDRLDIERAVIAAFGPESTAEKRHGRVVVATQVIEQSLDLDFDEMVSDLAPVDLLIQRAGRLKRHLRDSFGNRLNEQRADEREPPILHVLSPPPDDDIDARWIRRLLPGTGAVYPDHGQLWLTARQLADRKKIQIPEHLRELIEAVYGESAADRTPEALQRSSTEAEGKACSDRSVARLNAIKIDSGYSKRDGQWIDESLTPTRLGVPSTTIRLACLRQGKIQPLYVNSRNGNWKLSECRITEKWLGQLPRYSTEVKAAIDREKEHWPKATRGIPVLAVNDPQQIETSAEPAETDWVYCSRVGLILPAQEKRS